jgi:hypothetical protein
MKKYKIRFRIGKIAFFCFYPTLGIEYSDFRFAYALCLYLFNYGIGISITKIKTNNYTK